MKPAGNKVFLRKLRGDVSKVRDEVARLYAWRKVYKKLVVVFKSNQSLADEWTPLHTFIFSGYTAQASMTVRRLMDRGHHRQTVSLANLVQRLCDHPDTITRSDYLQSRRGPIPASWADTVNDGMAKARDAAAGSYILDEANREYDAYSGPGQCRLSRYIIARRYCEARRTCDAVLKHADKRLAHCDRNQPGIPKWGDLDKAIHAVGDLFCYVSLLVTGSAPGPRELAGTWQGGKRNWEGLLRVPWVQPASR